MHHAICSIKVWLQQALCEHILPVYLVIFTDWNQPVNRKYTLAAIVLYRSLFAVESSITVRSPLMEDF